MKLIGKQIVVELPEKKYCGFHKDNSEWFVAQAGKSCEYCFACKTRNDALTEAARMNPAWEVDEESLIKAISGYFVLLGVKIKSADKDEIVSPARELAHCLASNPSAWLKRKDIE